MKTRFLFIVLALTAGLDVVADPAAANASHAAITAESAPKIPEAAHSKAIVLTPPPKPTIVKSLFHPTPPALFPSVTAVTPRNRAANPAIIGGPAQTTVKNTGVINGTGLKRTP